MTDHIKKALDLLSSQKPAVFVSPADGDILTVGLVIAYSDTPVVLIESPGGGRMMAGVENIREATEDEWLTVLPSQTQQRDEEKPPAQLARELLLLAQEAPGLPGRSVHAEGTERILQAAQTYATLALADALRRLTPDGAARGERAEFDGFRASYDAAIVTADQIMQRMGYGEASQ